uniref:Apple domain-containing protein n=1 Tax=Panagrellus redivivus TaxID=6233 RepID=A0A7E4W415_PANRE
MYALLILLLIFPTIYSDEYQFIHFLGYGFAANYFIKFSTTNVTECIYECISYGYCVGVQFDRSEAMCWLNDQYNAWGYIPGFCGAYVINTTMIDIAGRKLGAMDQLLQNLVYASADVCPFGYDEDTTKCFYKIDDESYCENYPSFLGISWNGTGCVVPKLS